VVALALSWWHVPGLSPVAQTSAPPDRASVVERDARLVLLARADPREFEHLVRLYERRVYATALRLLGEPSDAEDVAQEAFVRAFRSLERFDVTRPFGPWVCVIAANLARDQLRSPLRRFRLLGLFGGREEAAPRARDPIAVDEEREEVARALAQLTPPLREAVVLRFVSDLSIEEIARALGIGESAAKMRLKRGLAALREIIGEATPLDDELDG